MLAQSRTANGNLPKRVIATATLLLLAACATPRSGHSLYEELGSAAGIGAIVNGLLLELAADERIRHHFTNINIAGFRGRLETHFCEITDGPCNFDGRSMQESHRLLGIKESDFNALVEDLMSAMDKLGIPYRTQNAFLARLSPLQPDIVAKP